MITVDRKKHYVRILALVVSASLAFSTASYASEPFVLHSGPSDDGATCIATPATIDSLHNTAEDVIKNKNAQEGFVGTEDSSDDETSDEESSEDESSEDESSEDGSSDDGSSDDENSDDEDSDDGSSDDETSEDEINDQEPSSDDDTPIVEYDNMGNIVRIEYPDGTVIMYHYVFNSDGSITSITLCKSNDQGVVVQEIIITEDSITLIDYSDDPKNPRIVTVTVGSNRGDVPGPDIDINLEALSTNVAAFDELSNIFDQLCTNENNARSQFYDNVRPYYHRVSLALQDLPDSVLAGEYNVLEPSIADEDANKLDGGEKNGYLTEGASALSSGLAADVTNHLSGLSGGLAHTRLQNSNLKAAALAKLAHTMNGHEAYAQELELMQAIDAKVRYIYDADPESKEAKEARNDFMRLEAHLRELIVRPEVEAYNMKIARALESLFDKIERFFDKQQLEQKYFNDGKQYRLVVIPRADEPDDNSSGGK